MLLPLLLDAEPAPIVVIVGAAVCARIRLKCTKQPPRLLNCGRKGSGNSRLVRCSCDPVKGNRRVTAKGESYAVPLVNKWVNNNTMFPTTIESLPTSP